MIAVLILIVIFGGIALVTYVDNTTKAGRRAALSQGKSGEALAAGQAGVRQEPSALPAPARGTNLEILLPLPEPARSRAWALLCLLADTQAASPGSAARPGAEDVRTTYLLTQTRDVYLPDTLRAYLGLTEGARQTLTGQGQVPERLLEEQLALIEDGVREALRHDHAAADRLLTQGRFLRERFGAPALDLRADPQP